MNKIVGLTLSILFVFEIFLFGFGIPLATQATTPPSLGQGQAYYIPQNNTVVFVYNVSGITLSTANATALQNTFASYFNVNLNVQYGTGYSQTYTQSLSISNYAGDVYFAYNPGTNKIEYVIILADVVGQSSISGQGVPVSNIYKVTGIPSYLVISNDTSKFTPAQNPWSIPVIKEVTQQNIQGYITDPSSTAPQFFYEYISGQFTQSGINIGGVTISTTPTSSQLVFAPFAFVAPGFYNPLQNSGALGPALQKNASTGKPYIWGRALINTTMYDPFVYSGTDNITFQLNYSTPGPLQISMAQLGYIASITNYPSSLTYLSYRFANGYLSFLGFIADYNSTSGQTTLKINGVTPPISGLITIEGPNGKQYTYAVILIAITSQSGVVESFSNLTVYYYVVSGNTLQLESTEAYHNTPSNNILPVYGYTGPLTITGTFNGTSATVTISQGSAPTLNTYNTLISLTATAYEGITAKVNGYYTTSPILSTPPTSLSISGKTTFQDAGYLYPTYAKATVTLLTNATLTFNNIRLPGISFAGIVVTPAYPLINGTSAMQYMATAQYTTVTIDSNSEYELLISGSQIVMQGTASNLQEVKGLASFSDTIIVQDVPGSKTDTGPLTLEFVSSPQYAYITLVNLKIWNNQTSVVVQAYSGTGQKVTVNTGHFYAVIIPPRISISKITPQSFECTNASYVYIYDPDAILVPGNPTGSFTYATGSLNYNGNTEQGAIVFYGSTVYEATGGVFANSASPLKVSSPGSVSYTAVATIDGLTVNQLSLVNPSLLQYYADNNPTVNFYFEQPNYLAGLTVSYNNSVWSSQNEPGYLEITPQNAPHNADYIITNYVTFKVLSSYAPNLVPYQTNAFITITPNASFVGATDYYNYVSTDYAVYYHFSASGQYQVQTQITVPNITATLYFANAVTPLYASYASLYFNESYYGASLPAYLALGTNGPLIWNAPSFQQFGVYATPLYLSKMLSVNVTLPNGNKYTILLTTKNISTLFVSLVAQQLQSCNGIFEFEISIPGLESILNMNVKQLNGSTLTVSVYDYVTHETLVASTKLAALSELALVAKQPGEVFYFLTFKASNVILTASTPWFIATSMYKEPALNFTDLEYAHTNPTSILHLTVNNITVFHNGYKAMVYYNATSGRTIAVNVYGKVVANYSGNLLPTISETAANSGMFNGTLPFTILSNNTVNTLTMSNISIYTNGTLALTLSNGNVVPLGPAGLFVLPIITYQGKLIGYNANVSVTVSDPVSSVTVPTYLTSANITPIRLAPIPTIPPISNAPVGNYYYTSSVSISPSNPVINIYASSVLPYPFEFYIIAIARPGVNASSTAPVVYYSYQAVVAKPALGIASQPYIEVAVQMSGIIALPAGSYTIQMFAVPFAQGPTISEYPASLVFTNVTIL